MPKTRVIGPTIFVTAIAAIAAGAFVWSRISASTPSIGTAPKIKLDYRIDLLADSDCSPGKVVQAVQSKKVLREYACTEQDASVAWVSIRDEHVLGKIDSIQATAEDAKGQRYVAICQNFGSLNLVRIERGYGVKPSNVAVRLGYSTKDQALQYSLVTLRHFADPVIVLPAPSPNAPSKVEPISASFVQGPNVIEYNVAQPAPKPEIYVAHLLAMSYCSSPTKTNDSVNDLSEVFASAYGAQSDAIKVRLARARRSVSSTTLAYKDAEVESKGGLQTLQLPTSQVAGNIFGRQITVASPKLSSAQPQENSPTLIVLTVSPEAASGTTTSKIHCKIVSFSPKFEDLGIDDLTVKIQYADQASRTDETVQFHRREPTGSSSSHRIPELKINLEATSTIELSSQTMVLPLRHRKKGPLLNLQKAPDFHASLMPGAAQRSSTK